MLKLLLVVPMMIAAIGSGTIAAAHETTKAAPESTSPMPPAARDAAAVVDAFHDALGRGDTNAVASLLAADALIFESGGVERGKAEYAAHHLNADASFATATRRTVNRRTGHAIADLAWVATEATTTGSYKDRAINSVSTETMILRRERGEWRIVHVHWSSAAVK